MTIVLSNSRNCRSVTAVCDSDGQRVRVKCGSAEYRCGIRKLPETKQRNTSIEQNYNAELFKANRNTNPGLNPNPNPNAISILYLCNEECVKLRNFYCKIQPNCDPNPNPSRSHGITLTLDRDPIAIPHLYSHSTVKCCKDNRALGVINKFSPCMVASVNNA